tara:strand:- start:1970 stop:2143 length:174 start_codon:yes stop_codon:yes gene_type:complete
VEKMKLSKEENRLIIQALSHTSADFIKQANKGINPNVNSRKGALMAHLMNKLKEVTK